MNLTWVVADIVEGDVLDELPLVGDTVARAVSTDGSAKWTFSPTDPRTPKGWHNLLELGQVMVVALLDGFPLQAWPLTEKELSRSSNPEIGGPTLDGLLSRVIVRDYEAYGIDEAYICQEIAEQVFAPGWNFTTRAFATGTVRDTYYDGTSDLTLRALLDEYASSEPPIKFACDIAWAPGQEGAKFTKTLRIGADIGNVLPSVIFDSSNIADHKRSGLFSEGNGATRLWAVADGSGESRPIVGPFESDALVRKGPWESRVSFETAQDEDDLAARGRTSMAERENGTETWQFVLKLENAPRPGREWDIGDTVTFEVEPSDNDPVGGTFTGEILSFDLDRAAQTVTPVLKQKGGEPQ